MVKAVVTGAGGRMGGRIITLISAVKDIRVVGAVEQKGHALAGKDVGEALGLGATGTTSPVTRFRRSPFAPAPRTAWKASA